MCTLHLNMTFSIIVTPFLYSFKQVTNTVPFYGGGGGGGEGEGETFPFNTQEVQDQTSLLRRREAGTAMPFKVVCRTDYPCPYAEVLR